MPQVALALFETQAPLHMWYPALHSGTQRVPLQVFFPIASCAQLPQVLPQDISLVLLSAIQTRLGRLPQAWKLELQLTSQVVPVQAAAPLAGAAQAMQPLGVQPASGLLFRTQRVGPLPGQPWYPVEQATLQVVPVQTAIPDVVVGQALQPVAVQPEAGLLSATHIRAAAVHVDRATATRSSGPGRSCRATSATRSGMTAGSRRHGAARSAMSSCPAAAARP